MLIENDRKANIDVLEANKNSNKEEIKKLRDDNKEFRQKLAALQRVSIIALSISILIDYAIMFLVECF